MISSIKSLTGWHMLILLAFIAGALGRFALAWYNPTWNAFDNHYEPVTLLLKTGEIPAKDACWQCYQPPVYYVIDALVAKACLTVGASLEMVTKILQLLGSVYNILSLVFVGLVLKRMPLSVSSQALAFSAICFLPRHIYMAGMHCNDNLAYLLVAVCSYIMMIAIDKGFTLIVAVMLSCSMVLAIFTKYTSLIVAPMALTFFVVIVARSEKGQRIGYLKAACMVLLPATFLLVIYTSINLKNYGVALPFNNDFVNIVERQPRDSVKLNFVSFTPWNYVYLPILSPGQLHSFWTLIYAGAWFDTEPKYMYFTDPDIDWWRDYYVWLSGRGDFPAKAPPLSKETRVLSAGLIALGIIPLMLFLYGLVGGLYRALRSILTNADDSRDIKTLALVALLLCNIILAIMLAVKLPVYSAMKTSYMLNSFPAIAFFLAAGLNVVERHQKVSGLIKGVFGLIVFLASLHILQVVIALAERT